MSSDVRVAALACPLSGPIHPDVSPSSGGAGLPGSVHGSAPVTVEGMPCVEPSSSGPCARRSCLVVPGSAPEKLAKAAGLGADEVVIDLEDAVVPDAKDAARADVVAALRALDWSGVTVSVRVNAPRTPWCHADVAALAAAEGPLRSLVLPKVESAGDVAFAERLLDGVEAVCGRPAGLRVQALIESAAGVARAVEIAAASPRLEALILGYADLSASLGRTRAGAADAAAWQPVRELVLLAARAAGLQAIDGPHFQLRPDAAFDAAVGAVRDQGFDGKWAIHPAQVERLNALFTPTAEEVAHARAVIAALAAAERDGGQGAVALDGQMLDEPVRRAAQRVLAAAGAQA
jgi:citrate lyase subunit beta / citryl-CoA lyase